MSIEVLPTTVSDQKQLLLIAAIKINEILKGRMNCTGSVTLAPNVTTTVVADNQMGSDQVPLLIPTTANAAAAISTTYVSARVNGSFTLTHANNAQVDKSFLYVRIG